MATRKPRLTAKRISELLKITEDINRTKDIDSLLDKILSEARTFTNADAGSIYLREENELEIRYVQNETIAEQSANYNKHLYKTHKVPINENSIAGYVALTGKPLLIDDAYQIPDTLSYSFNRSFDKRAGYRTRSLLTIPVITSQESVIGVLQIINAHDKDGNAIPFTEKDQMLVSFFGNNAAVAIERAKMTREIILRMVKMAELRDPKETGAHVNRVSSYTIEIYERWAINKGIARQVIKRMKDILRIASMLHDVGKVAISDTILKKPAKLTDEEYEVMKTHSLHGARLFDEAASDWDAMSAEIAFNHHERWDGNGYPGHVSLQEGPDRIASQGKKGTDIPISGRIVALADVYDALISKRVYKDAWQEEDVLEYIKEQSGKQFDPEVVKAFLEIYDVIRAIREKYTE